MYAALTAMYTSITSVHIVIITEGRKEMFYLTTHSAHFILRLYGIGHRVNDHIDSERRNPLPPHGLLITTVYTAIYLYIVITTVYSHKSFVYSQKHSLYIVITFLYIVITTVYTTITSVYT